MIPNLQSDAFKKAFSFGEISPENSMFMVKDNKKQQRPTPAEGCFHVILDKTYAYIPKGIRYVRILGDTMGILNSHKKIERVYAGFFTSNEPKEKDRPVEIFYGLRPEHRYMIYTDLYPILDIKFNQLNKMFKNNHGMFADYITILWDLKEHKYWHNFYYNEKQYSL